MARLASSILALASAALASCTHTDLGEEPLAASTSVTKVTQARAETVPYAYRPGDGVVESVSRVEAAGTAAAGASAGRLVDGVGYRLTVRMDDGSIQTVLQDSSAFAVGDRVRLSDGGQVIPL